MVPVPAYWNTKTVPEDGSGILSASMQSHTVKEVNYIDMGKSNYPDSDERVRYMKMKGRKVYEYAMKHVPARNERLS